MRECIFFLGIGGMGWLVAVTHTGVSLNINGTIQMFNLYINYILIFILYGFLAFKCSLMVQSLVKEKSTIIYIQVFYPKLYDNTHMQYTAIFHSSKNNEYTQSMF